MSGHQVDNGYRDDAGRQRPRLGRLLLAAALLSSALVVVADVVDPRVASAASPTVSTIAATAAPGPLQIVADREGRLVWTGGVNGGSQLETVGGGLNIPANPSGITLAWDGSLWATFRTGGAPSFSGPGRIVRIAYSPSPSDPLTGTTTSFTDPTITEPVAITVGPDYEMWFTNENTGAGTHSIGRITTTGAVSSFPVNLPAGGRLNSIVAGPDGNLWFTNEGTGPTFANSSIGRITPAGFVTLFSDPGMVNPHGIAAGQDGNLWFANRFGNSIGRITPNGVVSTFTDPSISGPVGIVAAVDGAMWFTNSTGGTIGRITTGGSPTVTSYTNVPPELVLLAEPWGITNGPGGDLFFTDRAGGVIGKVDIPTYTVNGVGDDVDATPGDDLCATLTGECTLRAAIQESNAHPGRDVITFDIPGPGEPAIGFGERSPHIIRVVRQDPQIPGYVGLPLITEPVTIDGFTQPGSFRNMLIKDDGTARRIRIQNGMTGAALDPFNPPALPVGNQRWPMGLAIGATAPATEVRGVAIARFSYNSFVGQAGIDMYVGGANSKLEGMSFSESPVGLFVDTTGTGTTIGGAKPDAHNTFFGNGANANLNADNLTFSGNSVLAGSDVGLKLNSLDNTLIGGTAPGAGNIFYDFYGGAGACTIDETSFAGSGTRILGNTFGLLPDGVTPDAPGPRTCTVLLRGANSVVGDGTAAGRNVFANSRGSSAGTPGVVSFYQPTTVVRGNYFGTDVTGTVAVPNNSAAIYVGSSPSQIGGNAPGDGNLIANGVQGVVVGPGGFGARIVGNSMFDNGDAGITLQTGANNQQDAPALANATVSGPDLDVDVSLFDAAPFSTFPVQVDVYVADSAASGEGRTFVGRTSLAGALSGPVTLPGAVALGASGGRFVVATATDANGNTSTFSSPTSITGPSAVPAITLAFGVATGSPDTVEVARGGIRVTDVDRGATSPSGPGSIAASSIADIGVEDTALAEISIDSTPLRAVVLESAPLRAVPLQDIVVNPDGGGGWTALLAGTDLENVPLVNLTFGDALANPVVFGRVGALPLRAVEVQGTPLRAVSLAALVLGSTPLRAVPLRAVGPGEPNPWCAIIQSLIVAPQTCDDALGELNLMEVTLRGAPLRAVDLSSIPLRAVDINASPLRAVPLRAVDLEASPLRAVPLRAVDLQASPLRAVPLRAVPLRAVPLRAVDLQTAPLRAVDVDSAPLRAVVIEGLSVNGTPLRAVPLRAVPLRAVDLEASPLRAVPLRAVPLRAVPLRAVELQSTPLRAVPLRAVDIAGSPLSAIPLRAVDLQASPLRAVPLRAVPLRAVPLRAVPIGALSVNGTPLRAVPLRAVDVIGSPLRAVPLRAVTTQGAIDCLLVDCTKGTLGDAVLAGAVPANTTLGDIIGATSGIRLSDIAASFRDFTAADLQAALSASTLDIGDLVTLDDMTLGDLPLDRPEFANLTLADLNAALADATLGDLVGRARNATTGAPYTAAELQAELNSWNATVGDLPDTGAMTMGDLLDAATGPVYLADLGSLLDLLTVGQLTSLVPGLETQVLLMDATLGDLSDEQLGNMTLLDLGAAAGDLTLEELFASLGGLLDDYTLGDLLLAVLDPSSLAHDGIEFDRIDEAELPAGTIGATRFSATFALTDTGTQNVTVEVALPASATYVPGTATVAGTTIEPVQVGQTLVWNTVGVSPSSNEVAFDVLPPLRLGATSITATATVVGTDLTSTASATVTVAEGSEPNDFQLVAGSTTQRATTPAAEDTVYLTYLPTATDIDVYEIDIAENDRLDVQLSNLDADLDIVLWGRPDDSAAAAALSPVSNESTLSPIADPDADGADTAVLSDIVRLDTLDPTVRLVAVSNQSGTRNETISTDRLPAGTYFVQVVGANGATNVKPASLQLKVREADAPPPCRATGPLPARVATPSAPTIPASADTLILVNETRLQQWYGATGRAQVLSAAGRLTDYLTANPALGINPVVVPVDAYAAVRAAYDDWDSAAGSCDPDAANAVVAAINATIIDPRRGQFEHIVFLGGDELIPMARIHDGTTIANEYDFRNELDGHLAGGPGSARNAVTAPFWESMIRSDEPYGDAGARRSGDGYLYVSDIALGRVVETPAEIADSLDTFVRFGGNLSIETATVLGYDFLVDGSERVADALAAAPLPVDRALADGSNSAGTAPWDADDATAELQQAGTRALVSLNAHFDHYRALPADGDKVPGFDDNLIASEVEAALGPDALEQSLVFSMGCHSGLSVSDVLIGSNNADWAQTLGRQGSLYVGNTGFGYGDTETVAYTEQLMALFAQQVTSPFALPNGPSSSSSTVGQALTWAKNEFVSGLQAYSVYDKKAVMESTFYGLPFYRVGLTPEALPPTPTRVTAPDATGTDSSRVAVTATNTATSTPSGTYYSNPDGNGGEQVIVAPGLPVQPRTTADISVVSPADPTALDRVARGAIVLDMTSTYVPLPNPVIATPIVDTSAYQPEPDVADVSFPAKPLEIATSTGPAGERQQLVVATGQYRSGDGVQRLDDDLDVVVYYSSPTETDIAAPTIGVVDGEIVGGRLLINATVSDAGSGVDRVYVLVVENPGTGTAAWTGVDLVRTGTTDRWTGALVLQPGTTEVEFLVQAKDDAGNVGVATNKAQNFDGEQPPAPVAPTPPATTLTAAPVGVPAASGFFAGPVAISVTSSGGATYAVDGIERGAVPLSGSFTITGDGLHTWSVTVPSGYVVGGTVLIDTSAPQVASDRASGPVAASTPITLRAADAGAGVGTITYRASGALTIPPTTVVAGSVDIVLPASGTTVVTVESSDSLGNASAPIVYEYVVDTTPPVVTGTATTTANGAGWFSQPVEIVWSVDDPTATVPAASVVLDEGVDQVITSAPSCDPVGNCATGSVTVDVDLTAPVVSVATDVNANSEDWNRTNVTVIPTCGADLSGVTCPTPVVVSAEAAGQTVSFSVPDVAGNVTSVQSRVINIDRTPPTVSWTAPANGAVVPQSSYVRPTCSVTDTLSGTDGVCTLDLPDPNTSTPGRAVYTATATGSDKAGNVTVRTSTYTVLTDEQGPVVDATPTPPANAAGWWRTSVTYAFTCTDPTGVATCPATRTVTAQGANQSFTVNASDLNGNPTVLTISGINIDTTPPVLTVTAPGTVSPLDTVTITCAASDPLSGIATAVCADRVIPASTLALGANTFTFSATDVAGNVATTTRTVTVVAPNTAPTVRADMGVAGLQEIGFQTNIVIIDGTFADPSGPGPWTASVRWTAGGPFTPLILNDGGRFVAAFIYGSAGVRTVTVRICDAGGACGTDDVVVRTSVTQRITPVRECVVDRGASTSPRYQVRWGYNNPAPFAIAVPSIPILENTFTSAPFLRGQPQILLPGTQRNVFTTTFSSGSSSWRINNTTATATASSPRC
jgi:uncharacterized protein YjbI with pentapeptide repeats